MHLMPAFLVAHWSPSKPGVRCLHILSCFFFLYVPISVINRLSSPPPSEPEAFQNIAYLHRTQQIQTACVATCMYYIMQTCLHETQPQLPGLVRLISTAFFQLILLGSDCNAQSRPVLSLDVSKALLLCQHFRYMTDLAVLILMACPTCHYAFYLPCSRVDFLRRSKEPQGMASLANLMLYTVSAARVQLCMSTGCMYAGKNTLFQMQAYPSSSLSSPNSFCFSKALATLASLISNSYPGPNFNVLHMSELCPAWFNIYTQKWAITFTS